MNGRTNQEIVMRLHLLPLLAFGLAAGVSADTTSVQPTDACGPDQKCIRVTCVASGSPGIGHCGESRYCPAGQCPINGACLTCPGRGRRLQAGYCTAANAQELQNAVANPACSVITLTGNAYQLQNTIDVTRPVTIVGGSGPLNTLVAADGGPAIHVKSAGGNLEFIKDLRPGN